MSHMNFSQKYHFRLLLAAYLAIFIGGLYVTAGRQSLIPAVVNESEQLSPEPMAATVLLIVGQVLWLAGVLGMLLFWPPSRYVFLTAMGALVFYSFSSSWHAQTCWQSLFVKLIWLISGAVLTLVFFGPTRQLFERYQAPSKASNSCSSGRADDTSQPVDASLAARR
jgi:hypothetical protein